MSEEVWIDLEVFPDLSFHLYVGGKQYYGLTSYEEVKEILKRELNNETGF